MIKSEIFCAIIAFAMITTILIDRFDTVRRSPTDIYTVDKEIADFLDHIDKKKYHTVNSAIKAILYEHIHGTTKNSDIVSVIKSTLETEIPKQFATLVSGIGNNTKRDNEVLSALNSIIDGLNVLKKDIENVDECGYTFEKAERSKREETKGEKEQNQNI